MDHLLEHEGNPVPASGAETMDVDADGDGDGDGDEDADAVAALGIAVAGDVEAKVRSRAGGFSPRSTVFPFSLSCLGRLLNTLIALAHLTEHQMFDLQQDLPEYCLGKLSCSKERARSV